MHADRPTNRARWARRALVGAAAAGLLLGSAQGVAHAKELGSGGTTTGGGTTVCNPVSAMGYRGDATTSDTGAATVQVDYVVKPCVKGQAVVVDTRVYLAADPAAVYYDNPAAPLSGKFTVGGITANTSYIAKVTVTDAATGAIAGTKLIYVAAVYKGV
jgi:hypothetical protein